MAEIATINLETTIVDANGTGNTTTASISPSADRLILAHIGQRFVTGTPTTPTLTGNGLTWVQVATANSSENRSTLFRAMGSSPSSGAVTIANVDSQDLDEVGWSIVEFASADRGGAEGSTAIFQVGSTGDVTGTSLTITLSAFADAANATFGGTWNPMGSGESITEGSGFTEVGEAQTGDGSIQSQFRSDNDTTVDWTYSTGGSGSAIAVEIKRNPFTPRIIIN